LLGKKHVKRQKKIGKWKRAKFNEPLYALIERLLITSYNALSLPVKADRRAPWGSPSLEKQLLGV
jgi:hypothetical protein